MFFRDLKPKKGATQAVVLAEVHIPVKLGHRDALKVFGDPLKAQLMATGLGTLLSCTMRVRSSGAVLGVDLSLGLNNGKDTTLQDIAGMLEALAAPCGSSIRLVEGVHDPIVFGRTEGLELAVGTPVAPDAEARRDLAMTCRSALEHLGVSRGWDERRETTVFYFYGESYSEMRKSLARALKANARFSEATIRRMA